MSTIKLHQEDELDGLLHDFFKSEMPKSFPALNLPEQPLRKAHQPRGFFSSRFALAASILLLMLGSLFLSGAFKGLQPTAPGTETNGTAKPVITPVKTK